MRLRHNESRLLTEREVLKPVSDERKAAHLTYTTYAIENVLRKRNVPELIDVERSSA
jgi:hypothetical protein